MVSAMDLIRSRWIRIFYLFLIWDLKGECVFETDFHYKIIPAQYMSCGVKNRSSWFPTRSDTKRSEQSHKKAGSI